jgi:hypothetical protein
MMSIGSTNASTQPYLISSDNYDNGDESHGDESSEGSYEDDAGDVEDV